MRLSADRLGDKLLKNCRSPQFVPRNVFGVVALHPISLTPRFSEVYDQAYDHNPESFRGLPVPRQKTAETVGARLAVVNTPLKQGVNERIQSKRNSYTREKVRMRVFQQSVRARE